MKHVFFEPWAGEFYAAAGYNGKKILALGESHYCKDPQKTLTQEVGNRFIAYKKGQGELEGWMQTFTRFANVFLGKRADKEEVIRFWNSIVFYNYVQFPTAGPRIAPASEEFIKSSPAFYEVLAEYQPDIIIVWGKRLWVNLPKDGREGTTPVYDENGGNLYYYKVGEREIPAYMVNHPSSPLFNYEWSPYLQEVMKLV